MATVETRTVPAPDLDDAARRRMMRRAIIASAAGTTIEWYDFFLYGVAAALVFPRQFFPGNDPVHRNAAGVLDLLRRLRGAARSARRSSATTATGSAARPRSSPRCS